MFRVKHAPTRSAGVSDPVTVCRLVIAAAAAL